MDTDAVLGPDQIDRIKGVHLLKLEGMLKEDALYGNASFIDEAATFLGRLLGANDRTLSIIKDHAFVNGRSSPQAYFIKLMFYCELNDIKPLELNCDFEAMTFSGISSPEANSYFTHLFFEETVAPRGTLILFFRKHTLPLPSALFPEEPDNTNAVMNLVPKCDGQWDHFFSFDVIRECVVTLNSNDAERELNPAQELCGSTFGSPEKLIEDLKKQGVTDKVELAARVDEKFPGISLAKLGTLLPANPGAVTEYSTKVSQGQRLRGKK